MSPIKISHASIQKFKELAPKIVRSMSEAMDESADSLINIVSENIKMGYLQPPHGASKVWPFVSDDYAKYTLGITPGNVFQHPGLILTGEMLGSVRKTLVTDQVTVIVDDQKSLFHEYGTDGLPARPFFNPATFFFKETDVPKKIIDKHIKKVFNSV